jgi:hypothetical protein
MVQDNIKTFDELEKNDRCFHIEDPDYIGYIISKYKSTRDLPKLIYEDLINEVPDVPDDYEWVILKTEDNETILFNYNCDPSGVICLK